MSRRPPAITPAREHGTERQTTSTASSVQTQTTVRIAVRLRHRREPSTPSLWLLRPVDGRSQLPSQVLQPHPRQLSQHQLDGDGRDKVRSPAPDDRQNHAQVVLVIGQHRFDRHPRYDVVLTNGENFDTALGGSVGPGYPVQVVLAHYDNPSIEPSALTVMYPFTTEGGAVS